MGQPKVAMPTPVYTKSKEGQRARDYFVTTFGAATVSAAETAVCLDIFLMVGIIKVPELLHLIEKKCQEIDGLRREQAMGLNG